MLEIIKAKYNIHYKIEMIFNDKTQGIVDLKDVIFNDHRKIFTELKDLNKFKKFKIKHDTICFENGLDLAPEFLHNLLKKS